MRDLETFMIECEVLVEKNVEVDVTGTLVDNLLAP